MGALGSALREKSALIVALAAGVVALFVVGASASHAVPRCPEGLVPVGARCCGEGQTLHDGACVGRPTRCAAGLTATDEGCLADERHVRIAGGTSGWQPPDTLVVDDGEHVKTASFSVDRNEVTWGRHRACVAAKACAPLEAIAGGDIGQAVHGITLAEARAFCAFAHGRLPRDAEWLRMALGDVEKRYPWGDPDAFCVRATFGLVDGPCAHDAKGPDTAGARPWGATPSGVLDVAGNVAEWVDDGAPEGMGAVRGGSYVDGDATSLRARWRKVIDARSRLPWVGLRCAYD